MVKFPLILFLSLWTSAYAGVLKTTTTHFKTTGTPGSFELAPEKYKSDFKYDILYYIPETLKDTENVKTLLFMHGGGNSTLTREGSLKVATKYLNSTLIKLADDLQMVVIAPSASGLNWGGHTVSMIRQLNQLVRKEVNVDHNNMGLSGHSMGGMGIGRNFAWLADEFSYILPMASTIYPASQLEQNLNKVFNVPYVHLQGLNDHYLEFFKHCLEQHKITKNLEATYNTLSMFEMVFFNGNHDLDFDLMKKAVMNLQLKSRDIFQNKLFGSLYYNNNFYTENGITFHQDSASRYFWIEILEASGTTKERLDFKARVINNIILIDFYQQPKHLKSLKVNLSKRMFSSDKMIELFVNGQLIEKRMLQDRPFVNVIDPEFEFHDFMTISF